MDPTWPDIGFAKTGIGKEAAGARCLLRSFYRHLRKSCFCKAFCLIVIGPTWPDIGFEKTGGGKEAAGARCLLGSFFSPSGEQVFL